MYTQVSVALPFCSGMPLCAVVVLLVSIIMIKQHMWSASTQVSVALLFCGGMPLCAGVVVLVFAIASLMDRWAVTHLMTVTRYGSQLPRLILGAHIFPLMFLWLAAPTPDVLMAPHAPDVLMAHSSHA